MKQYTSLSIWDWRLLSTFGILKVACRLRGAGKMEAELKLEEVELNNGLFCSIVWSHYGSLDEE